MSKHQIGKWEDTATLLSRNLVALSWALSNSKSSTDERPSTTQHNHNSNNKPRNTQEFFMLHYPPINPTHTYTHTQADRRKQEQQDEKVPESGTCPGEESSYWRPCPPQQHHHHHLECGRGLPITNHHHPHFIYIINFKTAYWRTSNNSGKTDRWREQKRGDKAFFCPHRGCHRGTQGRG